MELIVYRGEAKTVLVQYAVFAVGRVIRVSGAPPEIELASAGSAAFVAG